MPSPRNAAIKAIVDAWTVPGPAPDVHAQWQERLEQPSPHGWPVLAEAVRQLVAIEQERSLWKKQR